MTMENCFLLIFFYLENFISVTIGLCSWLRIGNTCFVKPQINMEHIDVLLLCSIGLLTLEGLTPQWSCIREYTLLVVQPEVGHAEVRRHKHLKKETDTPKHAEFQGSPWQNKMCE